MNNGSKLYSNLWLRIDDSNFDKLVQIQNDYHLNSVEDVLELLVNSYTINCLAKESNEYATKINARKKAI